MFRLSKGAHLMAWQPPASVAPLDAAIGSKEWAKRRRFLACRTRVAANAAQDEQILAMQAQLATLQAQLLSMLGPQPPLEAPPPHLISWRCRPSPVAPKAKGVLAPQAQEGDLAAKSAQGLIEEIGVWTRGRCCLTSCASCRAAKL